MTLSAEPIRMLLVEDSDVYRDSLVFLLQRRGDIIVLDAVPDARSASRRCSELRPDVVVLDYRLPDLDGGELAAELRECCPEAAVVFLSASAGQAEYDAAAGAGAALVRKDEGLDALVAAVRTAVRRSDP